MGGIIVFELKKYETLQLCLDYWMLNAVSVRDSQPILCTYECMDTSGYATAFSTLDTNTGYRQVEIADEDRNKTSLGSHNCLFRFPQMLGGLQTH